MKTQIEVAIRKLRVSPLFYLFLSSRELFHTNFWYWLSTLNPISTAKIFSSYEVNSLSFKREHNQKNGEYKAKIDLLISNNDRPIIVIENKVKDFPTVEQLYRIKQSFGNDESIEFVLTTLFWTSDLNGAFSGWVIKRYQDISNSIDPNSYPRDIYYQKLIEDYKNFSNNLACLSDLLPIGHSYDFAISLSEGLFDELNKIKLWEGYQKMRSSHLLHHYKPPFDGIHSSYSINNQKATLSFEYALPNNYKVGIQIEDKQFRKFVAGPAADVFAQNLLNNHVFFEDKLFGRGVKKFLSYGTDFRYQYTTIEKPLEFIDLFKHINIELNEIKNMESVIKNNIPTKVR